MFYDSLDNVCYLILNNKVKILLGDFNAKISKGLIYRPTIRKESLHRVSNHNSTRLVNFAMTRNMVVSNTTFPHKNIYKQTWVSPTGQIKNLIDHVIVDRRFKRCIMDSVLNVEPLYGKSKNQNTSISGMAKGSRLYQKVWYKLSEKSGDQNTVINVLKNGKGPGKDAIIAELLKKGEKALKWHR